MNVKHLLKLTNPCLFLIVKITPLDTNLVRPKPFIRLLGSCVLYWLWKMGLRIFDSPIVRMFVAKWVIGIYSN